MRRSPAERFLDDPSDVDSCRRALLLDLPRLASPLQVRFLDLGCGVYPREDVDRHCCEVISVPRTCELAAEAGWMVTGVDRDPTNPPQTWDFLRGDLTQEGTWHQISKRGPFDFVQSNYFISMGRGSACSPTFRLPESGRVPFEERLSAERLAMVEEYQRFLFDFLSRIARVLRPGGVAIINSTHLFRRGREGELILKRSSSL